MMILFITARWLSVITCCNRNILRMMMISVLTIAKPLKMAPSTKYGGKIVACQPGMIETAKSNETTLCTESTRGVDSPAKSRYARS